MPAETQGVKILVARELVSRCTFAHVVRHKGVDDDRYAVDCLVKDVEWLGATKIMLRSDNEPAITALLRESLRSMRVEVNGLDQVAEEHPPEHDPQANGAIESTVGQFKGLLRTYVFGLETRIGHRVPPDHPVVTWMVQHTAHMMTVRVKGEDGQTAYERVRFRAFNTRLLEFGAVCRHKLRVKDAQENGTLATRWGLGVFIGLCSMTGRYIVFDGEEVTFARTVVQVPDVQKWSKDRISAVNVRPYKLHVPKEPRVIFRDKLDDAVQPKSDDIRVARRLYIKKADVEAFGYTEGCVKCDHDLKYGFGRTTKGHSDPCRQRIMEELAKTPAGMARIQAAAGRAK